MGRLNLILALPLIGFILVVISILAAFATQVTQSELWCAFCSPETLFALKFTVFTSSTAMAVALFFGISGGYLMSRGRFPGKELLETILDIPLVMPPLIAGVGLMFLFGHQMLGKVLAEALGIHIVSSPWGAVAAQAFVATPIVLRSCQAAFAAVDRSYEEVARTLGLTPFQVMLKVNIPLAGKNILSGAILAWARAMGEFGATLMVAGATRLHTETLPIAVYLNISSGELGIAISCALVLLAAAFTMLLAARILQKLAAWGEDG